MFWTLSITYIQVGLENLPPYKFLYAYSLRTCSLLISIEWILHVWGTQWCSWLRHCTTRPKVAGSIPDGVIGVFHWLNPSGRTIASNRNEYQGYLLESKRGRCVGLITLPPSSAECLEILGASTSWSPKGLSRPTNGWICLLILHLSCQHIQFTISKNGKSTTFSYQTVLVSP
jgi:hypothetical protein